MTVDETCSLLLPENKAQSCRWVRPGSPRLKKFKTQPSGGKMMAKVFWDAKGVIGLFTLEKYNNWSVLCKLARPTENRHP